MGERMGPTAYAYRMLPTVMIAAALLVALQSVGVIAGWWGHRRQVVVVCTADRDRQVVCVSEPVGGNR